MKIEVTFFLLQESIHGRVFDYTFDDIRQSLFLDSRTFGTGGENGDSDVRHGQT